MKKYYFIILSFLVCTTAFCQNTTFPTATIDGLSIVCPGSCEVLVANPAPLNETTDYTVSSINYQPAYSFSGGVLVSFTGDDTWTSPIAIPFPFSFYGVTYNQLLIGSNGVITFNTPDQFPNNFCEWQFSATIPNQNFQIKNAIYGVYQDTNLSTVTNGTVQNINYYVEGTTPNRAFIINFNQLPLYGNNQIMNLQTSQIVLYETTNTIDINIKKRSSTIWNNGNGLVGIQNQTGTMATVPPSRNTGAWYALNEAWHFSPNGNSIPVNYLWEKNGIAIPNATTNSITICPSETDTYDVSIAYADTNSTTVTASITVSVAPELPIQAPVDLYACSANGMAVFDLSTNTDYMLSSVTNPADYTIDYYETLSEAEIGGINTIYPVNFASSGQVIYARILDTSLPTYCVTIKPFQLIVSSIPSPPTGADVQVFTAGQTLADLQVSGTNIQWYSEAVAGDLLPSTTLLVNGTTYYASQTNAAGCESRQSSSSSTRLPVTVYDSLGTNVWTMANLKASPNPVINTLNLSYDKNIASAVIYNLLGQEIVSKTINATASQIDMSSLAAGTYLLKVTSEHQTKTIKVIKQ